MSEDDRRVTLRRDGRVLTIALDRPGRHNAVDARMGAAIANGIERLESDDGLAAGVLTGGPNLFTVGFDLKTFEDPAAETSPFDPRFLAFLATPPRKPLVAAVEGMAVGAGFEMVLACDLVVASTSARFALPEVKRGLLAGGGGLLRLGQRVPRNEAMALALTGGWLSAQRAHDLGLVHALTPDGGAAELGRQLAATIAANAPLAVDASKQIIRDSVDWPAEEAFDRQDGLAQRVITSRDALEGAHAFLEKRPPRWSGT